MLKVGDKCKWSAKAIRSVPGHGRQQIRKYVLKIVTVHPDFDHKVKVMAKEYGEKPIGWYKQSWLDKL